MTWTRSARRKMGIVLFASLIALIVLTQYRAAQRENAAETDFPPEGHFVFIGGQPVHAVVAGNGPDLVLIHGASGNARDFTFSLVDRLAEKYRVIAFDRPGFGHSAQLPGYGSAWASSAPSLSEQAQLLRAAAKQLGAHKPIVLGQSYGGAVALAWAVEYPDALSALVLVAAVSNSWSTGVSTLYDITGSTPGGALIVPLITAYAPQAAADRTIRSVFDPQPVPDGYSAHLGSALTLRRDSFRTNARQIVRLLAQIEVLVPRYDGISVPVEILHGDADTIVPYDIHSVQLVEQIEGSNLKILPGIGHMPHHVATVDTIAAIDRAAHRAGLH